MATYITDQFSLSEGAQLTVKSSALRYLAESVNANDEMLVFVWGNHASEGKPQWLVSSVRQASLPNEARHQGVSGQFASTTYLIVQESHLAKLDGLTLYCEDGTLGVR